MKKNKLIKIALLTVNLIEEIRNALNDKKLNTTLIIL